MRVACVVAILWVAACGKSQADPVVIDFGEPRADVGLSDGGNDEDAASGDMSSENNGTPPDTERPDLEVVLEREVTFTNGEAELLAFDVPEDAVSVVVSVTGEAGHQFTLAGWTNGDGSDLVEYGWLDTDPGAPTICISACTLRVSTAPAAFAAIAPNSESHTVEPGQHTIIAYGIGGAGFAIRPLNDVTAMVRVVIKRLPAAPSAGVLDINFYLTGARGWTSETAPADAEFQEMVAQVDELYDQVGIDVGTITYTDIGEEYAVIENVLLDQSGLEELFALSANQPRNAVNVFLVEELVALAGGGFGAALGFSGGIPGPPQSGTRRSGVVINTKGDPALPIPTAAVLAHELGHHLGLFHTSEAPQRPGDPSPFHDPIADTPQDDPTQLMFHASVESRVLTATQGMVMRGNPWVNHEEAP